MTDMLKSIAAGIQYIHDNDGTVPPVLYLRALRVGAVKAIGDLTAIRSEYHDLITETLITFFESKRTVASFQNKIKQGVVRLLGSAFDMGWSDGGGGGYPSGDALDWYNSRVEMEFGYIRTLFQEAKEIRKEKGVDFFGWVNQRADGYTRTVREFYNAGKTRASKDIMVTFVGDDGEESCEECSMLKGQRHRVSWFVRRNFVPPHGIGLSCHRGRYCQHYLVNDKGEQVTA